MRIVVTGGGTGGHIFPALELVKEIKRENKKIEVVYVGNKNSLEERMAATSHIPFYGMSTRKLVGQGFFKKIIAIIFLLFAIMRGLWLLLKLRPRAVIGVGGYVSVPLVIASTLLGIKRYICEQNAVPGMANKFLSFLANRIFISFEDSRKYFPKHKTIHSGNPVRSAFFTLGEKTDGPKFRILITGGSLGARFLNREIPKVMSRLAHDLKHLEITHQTGEASHDEVVKLYTDGNVTARVLTFIDNMPHEFSSHDLLISRAGATVCAEIMASGMPAILVPYPFANGHQKYNAESLTKLGAAIMLEERENFSVELFDIIKRLYEKPVILHEMSKKAKSMGSSKAATVIITSVLKDLV